MITFSCSVRQRSVPWKYILREGDQGSGGSGEGYEAGLCKKPVQYSNTLRSKYAEGYALTRSEEEDEDNEKREVEPRGARLQECCYHCCCGGGMYPCYLRAEDSQSKKGICQIEE